MAATEDPAKAEKTYLENAKLRADIAKATLEASMLRMKLPLEMAKLTVERELLEQKRDGREKTSKWQLIQPLAVFLGVVVSVGTLIVALYNYEKSLSDARFRDLQTALDHYQKGWLPGVAELGEQGRAGVRALVLGVDATGTRSESHWPYLTQATLDELLQRTSLVNATDEQHLRAAMEENRKAIEVLLLQIKDVTEIPEPVYQKLHALACIQLKLQKLVGVPNEWAMTEQALRRRIRQLPDC